MSRRPRRPRRRWPLVVLAALALGIVFLLGVALGLTLEERPRTGDTKTTVRTFLPPAEKRTTATETATNP